MCDEPAESAPSRSPQERRAQVLARLRELATERDAIQERRRVITEELHTLLRRAHDLGSTWQEIADSAGYTSAVSARNQALSARDAEPEPADPALAGTYSVKEAAQLLGVHPKTIYQWVKSGRITVADDRVRGTRVFLPDSTSSPD